MSAEVIEAMGKVWAKALARHEFSLTLTSDPPARTSSGALLQAVAAEIEMIAAPICGPDAADLRDGIESNLRRLSLK